METILSESWLRPLVSMLVRIVEVAAAVVIFSGAVVGFLRFLLAAFRRSGTAEFQRIRLSLGRFLSLGLEFQLGSDLLRTAVAPTWQQIGQLAAVAAIRTALNYFLEKEIRDESARTLRDKIQPASAQVGSSPAARSDDSLHLDA